MNTESQDLSGMDNAERERFLQAETERQRNEERESDARALKARARRAFLDAGGRDDEFEASYPALRERMIQDEALRALSGERRAGEFNDDGTVRW